MALDRLSPVYKFGCNAIQRDIDGAAPGVRLGCANSWSQRRIPFGDQFHRFLCIFGFCDLLGPPSYHHALPAGAIADFLDLQTDLRIGIDVLGLHSLSGEEVKFFSIVGVVHWHDVRAVVARAAEMADTLSL